LADLRHLTQHDLEQQVLRLSIAWGDLMSAGWAFESLIAHPSYRDMLAAERAALVEAAVVAYGRAFDSSRGRGLGADWPAYPKDAWQEEHESLLEYRNTFVGHSDPDPRTVTIRTDDSVRGWSLRVNLPVYLPGRAEMALEMCRDLHARLNKHLDLVVAELLRREREAGTPATELSVTLPR